MHTRNDLAKIAKQQALSNWHGNTENKSLNIQPLIEPFPAWPIENWDGRWCAAFVHYCCNLTGFTIPPRPRESHSCTLGGCIAWEEWAKTDTRVEYHHGDSLDFLPEAGDIVLYDRVFENHPHDHIGIVLTVAPDALTVAEGNVNNKSAIVCRARDEHIRAYIRMPDGFIY